ncbi:methionine adenosyltransferase 2 subunit beta-like [Acanthaster planci]|uniref:Methionine adenosyltransferase 2 subunit beta n=1 Tax=Acanthaster planci TaxID=133434 RepID=A0A8B7Z6D3_ACAPL|nr:methionine adenosyltransferase 2 subunit beta-like [Acanthaster planci]XP_022100351.1 methionine adenosyltransferase 2 subunit beta-like [Acanthaster planci]XP_022100352.1 methionine adenosyltransferase 2 subunit beta-like [Acanthaster planci]
MPKVLITGASGLLGRALVKEFTKASWDVVGLAFSRAGGVLKKVDLRDGVAVKSIISDFKPDVVIHSAAERRPDVVEKQADETKNLNVGATSTIASICGEIGAYMIYLSTDYIFDGKDPPYKVQDKPNPLNKYGQSKLDGEIAVQANTACPSAILRVPVLYGEVEYLEESAVTVLFKALLDSSKEATMCAYQLRYPTHVQDVALVCRQLGDLYLKNPVAAKGIFHWCHNEQMTKHDMAKVMVDIFGLKADHMVANPNPPSGTPRPYDCRLDCSILTSLGIGQFTKFREGIEPCLRPFYEKK